MLQREIVDNRGWATEEELMDYFAIGQCTPGIISVNTATFIGQKTRGNIGGIFATLGVVFPSTVIISIPVSYTHLLSRLPVFPILFWIIFLSDFSILVLPEPPLEPQCLRRSVSWRL